MGVAVHAALNGDRAHPATPRTPDQLAAEARATAAAGAASQHLTHTTSQPADAAG
jgi:uncharacterized protein (DUF849 family)